MLSLSTNRNTVCRIGMNVHSVQQISSDRNILNPKPEVT
jgi:hypothetical protein